MTTIRININEGGFFSEENDCNLELNSPTHVLWKGWDCKIQQDGNFVCEAAEEKENGTYIIRYVIQSNGFAKLTLKRPESKVEVLRKGFVIRKGQNLSGIMVLSDGEIEKRYAYFTNNYIQEMLNKFGITNIIFENPNQVYKGKTSYNGKGEAYQRVFSDGIIERKYRNYPGSKEYLESPLNDRTSGKGEICHKVSNATWAVVEKSYNDGNSHFFSKILYTEVIDLRVIEESLIEQFKKV